MSKIDDIVFDRITNEVKKEGTKLEKKIHPKIVGEVLDELKVVRPIKIKYSKTPPVEGLAHEMTEKVLKYIGARMPLLLVGHAGSGKTHIAIQCAKTLGLKYYSISVNEQTSKSDFLGYNDANGKLVKTNFRKAYEKGGVFIIDEIDAGNPNILTVVNSALSNDTCPFPDGMVNRHSDFVCVCTANTFGEGESLQYIGRNILDAATRDRFATLFIDYSSGLEKVLVPTFTPMLVELREHFKKNNTNHVVSTRAGLRMETMLASGDGVLTEEDIINCMNLHQETLRDQRVKEIVKKYVQTGRSL